MSTSYLRTHICLSVCLSVASPLDNFSKHNKHHHRLTYATSIYQFRKKFQTSKSGEKVCICFPSAELQKKNYSFLRYLRATELFQTWEHYRRGCYLLITYKIGQLKERFTREGCKQRTFYVIFITNKLRMRWYRIWESKERYCNGYYCIS